MGDVRDDFGVNWIIIANGICLGFIVTCKFQGSDYSGYLTSRG